MVELLVSLLSQSSGLVRMVAKTVFEMICPLMTEKSVQLIMDVSAGFPYCTTLICLHFSCGWFPGSGLWNGCWGWSGWLWRWYASFCTHLVILGFPDGPSWSCCVGFYNLIISQSDNLLYTCIFTYAPENLNSWDWSNGCDVLTGISVVDWIKDLHQKGCSHDECSLLTESIRAHM